MIQCIQVGFTKRGVAIDVFKTFNAHVHHHCIFACTTTYFFYPLLTAESVGADALAGPPTSRCGGSRVVHQNGSASQISDMRRLGGEACWHPQAMVFT